jgi:hypothetical protein
VREESETEVQREEQLLTPKTNRCRERERERERESEMYQKGCKHVKVVNRI